MIINKTKNKIMANEFRLCKNFICKLVGLMFSKKKKDFALIFEFKKDKRVSLHTFFVFYPIDIVFLNEKKEVIEIKENMKPFSFYFPKNKASYIIEFQTRIVKKTKTKIGDRIEF